MSDVKKPANVSAEQDLQDLTNTTAKQRNAFSDEEGNNNSTVRAEDADQSLSAIHTGDRTNYDETDAFKREGSEASSGEETRATGNPQGIDSHENTTAFESQKGSLESADVGTPSAGADLRPDVQSFDYQGGSEGSSLGATQLQFGQSELADQPQGFYENEDLIAPENTMQNEETVDAAPHSLSLDDGFILEDAAIGDVVGTVSAEDPEGSLLSYSLADDAGGMFTIDPETGEIKVASPLDYETQDNYSLTVNVNDGVNTTQQTYVIEVGDVNEGPEAGNIDLGSTLEDNAVQFTSADLIANSTDVEGDSLSITNVTVDPVFGTVTETAPGQFEFTPTEHFSGDDIPLSFTISDGEFTDTAVANIDVTPVSDAPNLSVALGDVTRSAISGGDAETVVIDASNVLNTDSGFTVMGRIINDDGTLSDPSAEHVSDDGGRIGITGYNDAVSAQIGSRDINGGVSEELIVQLDGSATSVDVGFSRLFSNEGGDGHHEQGFYTLYMDGEEVGSGNFTAESGSHVGSASISAEDGSAFDQIVFSSNNNWTGHEDGTGDSDYFITSISVEQEIADIPVNVYELNITADLVDTDGSEALSAVTISNIPEDATLSAGTQNDDGSWTVDVGDLEGLILTVPADMGGDFDITVSVASTDGTADPASSVATLTIPKIEHAPEQVALDNNSILEDASVGDVVGIVTAIDPNGDDLSYSLADDADGMFTIDTGTGEIKLAGGLDFETTENYNVTVNVSDGDQVTQQVFTINVRDIDEAVHSVGLDNNAIMEDAAVGDVVGTVTGVDPEEGSLSFSLSDDAGGMFTIDPETGEIKLGGDPDYETTQSYDVTVDVSDGANVTQETFTINIGDADAPVLEGMGNEAEIINIGNTVDLDNMDVFPDLHTSGDLEARVGTEVFEDMVKDAEDIVINHQSEATLTFQGEYAGYQNSIGAYQINSDGTLSGAQMLWGDASNGKLEAGVSTATYEGIESGSQLGFFVISDGFDLLPEEAYSGDGNSFPETGNWMFVSPDFDPATQSPEDHLYNVNDDAGVPQLIYVENDGTVHTQTGNVFHSTNQEEFNPDADPDMREHFVAGVDQENGILNFGFEDILGGGDHDFNDGMFSVEIDVRDLMEAPNPLFTRDEDGQSSFQINDADSTDLQEIIVTVSDAQDGDTLSLSGPYKIEGGEVLTFDGQETGISIDIVEDGDSITLTLSGDGDLDHYEAIIQNINFSNTSGSHNIAGVRPITVVAIDNSGEVSEPLESSFTIAVDEAVHTVSINNDSLNEDATIGDVLGVVSAVDPEGRGLTYALQNDADGLFAIDENSGEITLSGELDYETATSHSITVSVSDGVNVTYETFEINVGDVDESTEDPGLSGSADVVGTSSDDTLDGDNNDNIIYGYEGNDEISAGDGNDVAVGGAGDDNISGASGNDSLYGGIGDDTLSGGSGDDYIAGGSGDDTVYAGSGNDTIFGGSGDDVVYGQDGSDVYEFGMNDGMDSFIGGDGGGWSDTIVLSDGLPEGDMADWLTLTSGSVETTADGEIFLSEDAAGTISLDGNAVLTFEGVEKIEG